MRGVVSLFVRCIELYQTLLTIHVPGDDPRSHPIDLVITLGGDGTILHASSLFKTGAVPPVLSFSMGTLGFLLPFRTYYDPRVP